MPIPFQCPHCQLFTLVDDQYANHTGPCASCGKTVTVPPLTAPASTGASRSRDGTMLKVALIVSGCILVSLAFIAVIATIGFPAVKMAQVSRDRRSCADNLRKIGLALSQYHELYGSYPPPFLADAQGVPMHSWRVLILPYLGHEDIYNQYNFSEPWNGPTNSRLLARMPEVYGCPADHDAGVTGETSVVAIVGSRCVFRTKGVVRRTDVTDDPSLTLCLAEIHESRIQWMEPKDIASTEIKVDLDGLGGIGGNHPDGVNVLMLDFQPRFLPDTISEEALQALSTIDGKETIPWESLE